MSIVEYGQCAEDHQRMLILVQQVGSHLSSKNFSRLYERIAKVTEVEIPLQDRTIHLRYRKTYATKNSEWGDFQAHRRIVGLVCLGAYEAEDEAAQLGKLYTDIKQLYSTTLFDSRLFIFGPEVVEKNVGNQRNGAVKSGAKSKRSRNDSRGPFDDPLSASLLQKTASSQEQSLSQLVGGGVSESDKLVPGSTHVIGCPPTDDTSNLEEKVKEFVASLFWVLEGKRLDRSLERQEKVPMLTAPFEKKDMVGLDIDSRTYRKRYQGRLRKHTADLCLLAGLPGEAIQNYQSALDILKVASDWLWVAACYEGMCSASISQVSPEMEKTSFQRNISFSMKRGTSALTEAGLILGSLTRAYTNGLDLTDDRLRNCLLPRDVVDKYREAMMHYSKYKNAGIIELEACLKACRVLIKHKKILDASDFLQNVVYINIDLTEEEKIERYSVLASLYDQLQMRRKAAFFRRIAAMQCVQDGARSAWEECYNLLLQTFAGYKMSVDPKVFPQDVAHGWPVLQLRVLHETIYSARKMGAPAIAIRHLAFLLHILFDHLTSVQRIEIADVLESYTCRGEGTHTSLALDNGMILPPVPLLRLPTVTMFNPMRLPPHLQPIKRKSANESSRTASPFIYSPIQLGPTPRSRSASKLEFLWVQGEVCEVELHMYNPMAMELKIHEMGLLTEDVAFKACPIDLSIPADSAVTKVKLRGTPEESGGLLIIGYSVKVLGVRSHCRLRDLPKMPAARYHVRVVPALPWLQVTTSLSKADNFSSLADGASVVTSAAVSVLCGQSCVCQIQLTNCGREPVEFIDVSLDSRVEPDLLDQVLHWDESTIRPTLPLVADAETSFTLHIYGASDFLAPSCRKVAAPTKWTRTGSRGDRMGMESSDATVIEALVKLQYSGGPGLADGYYRHCVVAMTVEIQPSILITRWQVQPSERADYFVLILDILNASPDPLQVSHLSHSKSTLVIPTQQSSRISLEVCKCPTKSALPLLSCDVTDILNQHISDCVNIRWKMTTSDTCGVVKLDKLTWTNEDTAQLFASPLQWKIWLNIHEHRCGSTVYLPCGEEVRIKCQVDNTSDSVIHDAQFRMSCHQDSGIAGTTLTGETADSETAEDHCVCGKTVACIGSPTLSVKRFHVGRSCLLECSLVFLHPGRFKLAFDCCGSVTIADTSSDAPRFDDDPCGSSGVSISVSNYDMPLAAMAPPKSDCDNTGSASDESGFARKSVVLRYPATVELCVAQSGGS